MTDKTEKPDLKIVKKEPELTIKQRAFVDEIIKGKLGSYKEAYAKVYDVTLTKTGKIPKWVEVEASKLVANPKIALSLHKAIERKETSAVASSLRTRNYVLERTGSGIAPFSLEIPRPTTTPHPPVTDSAT